MNESPNENMLWQKKRSKKRMPALENVKRTLKKGIKKYKAQMGKLKPI